MVGDDPAGRSLLLPGALRTADGRHGRSVRDWCVDLVVVLATVALGALTVAGEYFAPHRPASAWLALDAVVAVLAPLALLTRRRWPVGLAVVLLVLFPVAPAAALPAGVAALTVAVHRRTRTSVAVSVLAFVAASVSILLRPVGLPPVALIVIAALVCVAGQASGMFVRARRELLLSLRERALRAEAEQRSRAAHARQWERTRIARDMHDVLASRISLLSMHAGALAFRPDAPAADIARSAEVIRSAAHDALTELTEVIGVLRDDAEPAADTAAARPGAVAALIAEARQAGDVLAVETVGTASELGPTAYRVLQEALTNARKHAPGQPVRVRIERGDETVRVDVRNPVPPGRGAPAIPGAGVGLTGLGERVQLAGGRLAHGPTPDGGFGLTAWIPSAA